MKQLRMDNKRLEQEVENEKKFSKVKQQLMSDVYRKRSAPLPDIGDDDDPFGLRTAGIDIFSLPKDDPFHVDTTDSAFFRQGYDSFSNEITRLSMPIDQMPPYGGEMPTPPVDTLKGLNEVELSFFFSANQAATAKPFLLPNNFCPNTPLPNNFYQNSILPYPGLPAPQVLNFSARNLNNPLWKICPDSDAIVVCDRKAVLSGWDEPADPGFHAYRKVQALTPIGERPAVWNRQLKHNILPLKDLKEAVRSISKTEDGSYNIILHDGSALPVTTQDGKSAPPVSRHFYGVPRTFISTYPQIVDERPRKKRRTMAAEVQEHQAKIARAARIAKMKTGRKRIHKFQILNRHKRKRSPGSADAPENFENQQ